MEHNAILDSKLSLSSNIPLYAQLVGIIKREISSGALKIGDLLPSEAELCRALDISRNTARQAIGELEDEDWWSASGARAPLWPIPTTTAGACAIPSPRRSPPGQDAVVHPGGFRRGDPHPGHLPADGPAGGNPGVLLHPCPQRGRGAADSGNLLLSPVHLSQPHPGNGPDSQLLQPAVSRGDHTLFRRGQL